MIISHKYKFIFIKTLKTAGTSVEVFLSEHCGANDILTPVWPAVEAHAARNYSGLWNPLRENLMDPELFIRSGIRDLYHRRRFYNHIAAGVVRKRISAKIWKSYFKFAIDRNPWDKTLSYYYWLKRLSPEGFSLADYFAGSDFCLNYPLYTDSRGDSLVDRVLKYERLNEDLGEVFAKLGIPFSGSLKVKAKSEYRSDRTHYRNVFSEAQKNRIEREFEREIALHNYEF